MIKKIQLWMGLLLRTLGSLPVLSFCGPLKGSWWSAYPQSSYWRGTFEPEITSVILQKLPGAGGCCWDFGAHFGYYSTLMARHVGNKGQVVSLEPNPFSYQRLRRHCRWNRLHQIRAFPAAASDKKTSTELINYSHPLDTATHLAYPDETRSAAASYTRIETVRMEDFAAEQRLREPDFIKIDVEGHGQEALAGCASLIARKHPTILFSVHTGPEYEGMTGLLRQESYIISRIDPALPESPAWPGDYLAYNP